MFENILDLLPAMVPTIVATTGLVKILKNLAEAGFAKLTGVFNKLPVPVTRVIAVVLGVVTVALQGGEFDASVITTGGIVGLISTLIPWITSKVAKKPERAVNQ